MRVFKARYREGQLIIEGTSIQELDINTFDLEGYARPQVEVKTTDNGRSFRAVYGKISTEEEAITLSERVDNSIRKRGHLLFFIDHL